MPYSIESENGASAPTPLDSEAKAKTTVLIVEDEHTLRESCASVLEHEGYRVVACGRAEEARELVQRRNFEIALIDIHMPQMSGVELLQTCRRTQPKMVVVMMTGKPSVDSSLEALHHGAWDYLPKPFSATHLQILIGRAAHAVQATRSLAPAAAEESENSYGHGERVALLGRSPAFLEVMDLARRVARTDASVFITGESGSGKEMIAQFIHHHSRRSERRMVALNCAALPETLLESEMFGHCKGAFTGAVRDKRGLLEAADGGTLFLDELTEMSHQIQAKLLRVIQDGNVRRVGSETTDAKVDVRFLAATNRDPAAATDEGKLRKDLYYRLNVVPLRVPALRERVEDIPLLAEHFLKYYWGRHRERGAPVPTLTTSAIRSLQARVWTGNVRELQNVMEHAVVLLEPGAEIRGDDLPYPDGAFDADATPMQFPPVWLPHGTADELSYHMARERTLGDFELSYLSWLIDHAGANMSKAAKIAGVDRTTLYRLMEKHGLERNTTVRAN